MLITVRVCSEIFIHLWKTKVYLKNRRFTNKKRNCDENEVLGLPIERFSGLRAHLMSDVTGWRHILRRDVTCVVSTHNKLTISGSPCRSLAVLLVFRHCYSGELRYMASLTLIDGNAAVFWTNNMHTSWCRTFAWIETATFRPSNFREVTSWRLNSFIGSLNAIGSNNVGFCKLVCGSKYLIDLYFLLV